MWISYHSRKGGRRLRIRIGIDIGSTHTDAVALEGKELIVADKVMTTPDLTTGLLNAISKVMEIDERGRQE